MKNLKPIDYFLVFLLIISAGFSIIKAYAFKSSQEVQIAIMSLCLAYIYAEITDYLNKNQ